MWPPFSNCSQRHLLERRLRPSLRRLRNPGQVRDRLRPRLQRELPGHVAHLPHQQGGHREVRRTEVKSLKHQ